jgi:23S rRNA pseudouridine1911/1915/1917 synthase
MPPGSHIRQNVRNFVRDFRFAISDLCYHEAMVPPELDILFEDNHCIAVAKPGNVLTTHFQGKEETLDRAVKAYLKRKFAKPGNVYLGVVHRLDRPVCGVLLFARNSKAAARLSEQFRDGSVEKVYWAIVEGIPGKPAGTLEDWLLKDPDRRRVEIVEPRSRGARQSLLHYQHKESHGDLSWLEVRPQTGRSHQLRVQLAHFGHPVFGDARYGSIHTFEDGIALHAHSLTFLHPVRYEPITLTAPVPRSWLHRFAHLLHGRIPDAPRCAGTDM